ncbi:MAG: methylated-DNA--[protein]-cysteine S-methyltransferase [Firmicutes bacterium]|nr:methylated-DNA--[protein]-cysteine S-methyltransferase [Bacillota bacterium]
MGSNYFIYKLFAYEITIAESGGGVCVLSFGANPPIGFALRETCVLKEAFLQLSEYFEGKRKVCDLRINLSGTDFQKAVCGALALIPYGETKTYKEIAEMINNPKAVRAVGSALNKNPVAVFVPCHRVVSKNIKNVGYAYGKEIKNFLLSLERNSKL